MIAKFVLCGIDSNAYHPMDVTLCCRPPLETVVVPTCDGVDEPISKMQDEKWRVMRETSGYSFNPHNYLLANGIDSILVNPSYIKLITKGDKKTDKNEAKRQL